MPYLWFSVLISLRTLERGDEATHRVLPPLHICTGEHTAGFNHGSIPGQPHPTWHHLHSAGMRGLALYSHWMYHALQIALLRRILSRQSSRSPLKFFHFGDTSFPLRYQAKERLKGTIPEPAQFRVSQKGGASRGDQATSLVSSLEQKQEQPCGRAAGC